MSLHLRWVSSHNSTMQDELLPLFPLQVVLFPRTSMPLHIFEERYKQMVDEVMRGKAEFGVVLAGEKGIVNTGCTDGSDHGGTAAFRDYSIERREAIFARSGGILRRRGVGADPARGSHAS